MRKQTKIAAVVSAAALLALGASITSFAAAKGTWMLVDGEWYCYDSNGDVYENTFCTSNGKDYYVGDDGMMVRSDWVEYDGDYYFVNSSGQKITNDWRLTTPYDDEDADEEWYYFQSTGKMAANKKIVWKNKTYYFDTDGKMLTGWVTADGTESVNEANAMDVNGTTYYCDETGARVEKGWVYDVEPGTADDDADADENWYYLKANGKVVGGRQASINGQTFFFDNETGKMLTGWVAATNSDADYYELYVEDEREDESISDYFATAKADGFGDKAAVYYCGYSEDGEEGDGHAKKNTWRKYLGPDKMANDEDNDRKWYWFEKDGKLFVASESDATALKYKFEDGVVVPDATSTTTLAKKKVNSKDYWFNLNGEMASGFYMIADDEKGTQAMYYFGGSDDGSMKTGSQSIKDDAGDTYKFYFSTSTADKGAGITGNKNNKLYYYGYLIQADEYKYQVARINVVASDSDADKYFIVNSNGSIQHGKSEYKEDGDVLIDAKNYTITDDKGVEKVVGATYDNNKGDFQYSVDPDTITMNSGLPYVEASDFVDVVTIVNAN